MLTAVYIPISMQCCPGSISPAYSFIMHAGYNKIKIKIKPAVGQIWQLPIYWLQLASEWTGQEDVAVGRPAILMIELRFRACLG